LTFDEAKVPKNYAKLIEFIEGYLDKPLEYYFADFIE
jgi:hypothetical protein